MPDRYPIQDPRAAWRVYDGEAVVVSPVDSTLHTLNGTGTLVWIAADGHTPLAAVVERLRAAYPDDAARIAHDVEAFVDALVGQGLLRLAHAPDETAPEPDARAVAPAPGVAYAAPAIASERIFETTALACAKRPGQSGKCNARSKVS